MKNLITVIAVILTIVSGAVAINANARANQIEESYKDALIEKSYLRDGAEAKYEALFNYHTAECEYVRYESEPFDYLITCEEATQYELDDYIECSTEKGDWCTVDDLVAGINFDPYD